MQQPTARSPEHQRELEQRKNSSRKHAFGPSCSKAGTIALHHVLLILSFTENNHQVSPPNQSAKWSLCLMSWGWVDVRTSNTTAVWPTFPTNRSQQTEGNTQQDGHCCFALSNESFSSFSFVMAHALVRYHFGARTATSGYHLLLIGTSTVEVWKPNQIGNSNNVCLTLVRKNSLSKTREYLMIWTFSPSLSPASQHDFPYIYL
jgi:hypothetical protein